MKAHNDKPWLNELVELIPDLVTVIDKDYRVIFSNWKKPFYVLPENRYTGQLCYNVYFGNSSPCDACHIQSVFKEKKSKIIERSVSDGTVIESRMMPLFDAKGEVVQVLEVIRDVTLYKKIVTDYETLFSQMFDGFALHEIICDEKGKPIDYRFLMVNPAFEKLTGLNANEIVGQTVLEVLPQTEVYWIEKYGQVALTGEDILFENYAREQDRYYEVKAFSPQHMQFATLISDVTEKKRAEEILKKEKASAELASEAKSMFLANMSHEMRTPLNSIFGSIDLISARNDDPEIDELLSVAKYSSENLLHMIDDVLDLSKIETGKMTVHKKTFQVYAWIELLLQPFKQMATEKGLDLKTSLDTEIPEYLIGDAHRMGQVMNNLLTNAIKFTDKGTVELRVTLASESLDSCMLEFKVIDSGIGIDKKDWERIFIPFEQADLSPSKMYGGSGLGLSIAKKIAGLLKGKVVLEKSSDSGSSFLFSVPLKKSRGLNSSLLDKKQEKKREEINVLVAEDDSVNQLIIKKYLENLGVSFHVVSNGQECVKSYTKGGFDVILMDCQMPICSGFEATEAIRQIESKKGTHVKIIALTAYTLEEDREKCFEVGMDDFLSKPLKLEKLKEKLF